MSKGFQLFHHPKDRLRLTVGEERSYITVVPAWAAPMSHPNRYLSLLDGKGEEIALLESLDELDGPSREAVETELRRRYLTATIHRILSVKIEFGVTYWTVITERGQRDFVAQSLQENAQWLSPTHLMILDIDGNRFEIPDTTAMDPASTRSLHTVI